MAWVVQHRDQPFDVLQLGAGRHHAHKQHPERLWAAAAARVSQRRAAGAHSLQRTFWRRPAAASSRTAASTRPAARGVSARHRGAAHFCAAHQAGGCKLGLVKLVPEQAASALLRRRYAPLGSVRNFASRQRPGQSKPPARRQPGGAGTHASVLVNRASGGHGTLRAQHTAHAAPATSHHASQRLIEAATPKPKS